MENEHIEDEKVEFQVATQPKKYVFNAGTIDRQVNRILVTGGAGFLGSHLIDILMEDPDNEVICLDNLFSGSKRNVLKWINHPRFEFIRHDVCKEILVEVDQIYHLACPASPVFYQNNGIKTIKTSVLGLAKRVGARLLLASTSEVYGDALIHPQVEEYWGNVNTIGIRSCYDEGKRIAETLWVEIRIARIFNTYGPRMLENDGRVVSNFIVQALSAKPLTVYGEGTQTRSFAFVSDTITALVRLMNQESTIGPINIGNPDEYTIMELATIINDLVGNKTEVKKMSIPSDDPSHRRPDITKAKRYLNWEPFIKLKEKTIHDFRGRMAEGIRTAEKKRKLQK